MNKRYTGWDEVVIPPEDESALRAAAETFARSGDAVPLEEFFRARGMATSSKAIQFPLDGVTYYRPPSGEWRLRA